MIKNLIRDGRIYTEPVIRAMEAVPREIFVPTAQKPAAYHDTPLTIGEGQTISAPHMVGIMVEALDLKPGQKILEIGAGSGYHAAVVANIIKPSGFIYSVERITSLAERARENIKTAGVSEYVEVIEGDGSLGYKEQAPYDRIFVTCASPGIPPPLLEQMKDDGMLLIPSGSSIVSDLMIVTKSRGKIRKENLGGCAFVPLRGYYGFK